MEHPLERNIVEATRTFESLRNMTGSLDRAASLMRECLAGGHKLLACGNGGSAADAAHLTTEFVCRYRHDRPPFPAISLASHGGDLSAIGNDYSFDDLFARQVHAFGQPGDLLLALTTSGQSENIRRALETANQRNIVSIAFLGRDGGACRGLATIELLVPGTLSARIQEAHKLLLHTLCEMVEPSLGG